MGVSIRGRSDILTEEFGLVGDLGLKEVGLFSELDAIRKWA